MREKAVFHLPGLFEFYEFYKLFLPIYREHRGFFYDFCEIGSIYGAPKNCLWGGGRVGEGENRANAVFSLTEEYGISARLTFSNSLLREEHLADQKCNLLCEKLANGGGKNGVIVHSELLLNYLREKFPDLYFVSSTTKVLACWQDFEKEVKREEFAFVVPDFRLNRAFEKLRTLTQKEKDKVEFLINECCWFDCPERKSCYEAVSRKNLGENAEHICCAPDAKEGYRFSKAMENPGFIGIKDIEETYLPMGFSNFKIEGRGLGSAVVLEMLLYYMVKPECQLRVREMLYLDSTLDIV